MTKKDQTPPGGGPRGVWQKTSFFTDLFFASFPNINYNIEYKVDCSYVNSSIWSWKARLCAFFAMWVLLEGSRSH